MTSSEEPSDEQLTKEFGVSPELSVDDLARQVEVLTARLGGVAQVPLKVDKGKTKGDPPGTSAQPKPPQTVPESRANLLGGRGRASRRALQPGRGARPASVVQKQLDLITENISAVSLPEAPADNVATAADLEGVSVRSSRLEEEVSDLSTQLIAANLRIESLESEQGTLVGRYTEVMKEMAFIKEILKQVAPKSMPSPALATAPSINKVSAPPAVLIRDEGDGGKTGGPAEGPGKPNKEEPGMVGRSRIPKKRLM